MCHGDNNNYYFSRKYNGRSEKSRQLPVLTSSRIHALVNRARTRCVRGNGKIAWEQLRDRSPQTIHRATIKSKLVRLYGGKGWQKRRSIGSRRCKKESVSPIETSPVRERKRQAPIANGTDGTNARVASLFLPANRVKSLRPPPPSPPTPLALPCTPALSLLLVFLLLFCWPFSYATHYAKNTRRK